MKRVPVRAKVRRVELWVWNQVTRPDVRAKEDMAAVAGHGLYSTRWKGWRDMGKT